MKKKKRTYDSPHRKLLAENTRTQILSAARRLFRDSGYARTTIDDIARQAGVATPTVYATSGGKRAILLNLLDQIEDTADASSLDALLLARADDEPAQLRAFVDFTVRLFTSGADLIRIAELAGPSDPDVAALWDLGEARRLETCRRVLSGWAARNRLPVGLTESRAIDILWALSGPEAYSLFVRKRTWAPSAFGDWLYETAASQLLRGDAPPPGIASPGGRKTNLPKDSRRSRQRE